MGSVCEIAQPVVSRLDARLGRLDHAIGIGGATQLLAADKMAEGLVAVVNTRNSAEIEL